MGNRLPLIRFLLYHLDLPFGNDSFVGYSGIVLNRNRSGLSDGSADGVESLASIKIGGHTAPFERRIITWTGNVHGCEQKTWQVSEKMRLHGGQEKPS